MTSCIAWVMIGKLRNPTTVIITPEFGYSGKGQMSWYLDLRVVGTVTPFGGVCSHQFYSLLPAWPLQACEFEVSGLTCSNALRMLGFKVRNDLTSTEARLCFCKWEQWSREWITAQRQCLDQGSDIYCPAWSCFHCPSLFVPD